MGDASHASGPRLKIVQAKWHHRKQTPLVSSDAHIPERTRAHVASYSVAAKRVWEREESDAQWASNKNDCNASASHFSCQPHRRRTIIYLYIYIWNTIYIIARCTACGWKNGGGVYFVTTWNYYILALFNLFLRQLAFIAGTYVHDNAKGRDRFNISIQKWTTTKYRNDNW